MVHGKWLRIIAVCAFLLDLVIKHLAVSGDYAVINPGVAFGVLIGSKWVFWVFVSVIFVWLYRHKLWLILAGGVANVVSRIVWGGVVDYWNFLGLFHNNLADWMIVGGILFVVFEGRTNLFRYTRSR